MQFADTRIRVAVDVLEAKARQLGLCGGELRFDMERHNVGPPLVCSACGLGANKGLSCVPIKFEHYGTPVTRVEDKQFLFGQAANEGARLCESAIVAVVQLATYLANAEPREVEGELFAATADTQVRTKLDISSGRKSDQRASQERESRRGKDARMQNRPQSVLRNYRGEYHRYDGNDVHR
jgi:hypothetical protein